MLRIATTNNSITWPATIAWYSNGTRVASAPATLGALNRIVVEVFDNMWTLGLISTNAGAVP
jgi:hypothetical protein